MATLPPPPKRNGGPPPTAVSASPAPVDTATVGIESGRTRPAQRIVIYGPGGIGKSSLAALAPGACFIDCEGGTWHLDVKRVTGVTSWSALRAALRSPALAPFQTIIIDSATKAEEWAIAHALATVPHEKGHQVQSIEGYGFGKGLQHVFDTFSLLLQDLDAQVRAGRNVILIAHDCTADVPNPVGDDFIRFEPHLQSPKSGKASIRNRVVQWADHVFFLGYDVIAKDGKGKGGGTRTIFPTERPDHVAKSRTLSDPMPFVDETDGALWTMIFGGEA